MTVQIHSKSEVLGSMGLLKGKLLCYCYNGWFLSKCVFLCGGSEGNQPVLFAVFSYDLLGFPAD